MFKALVFLLLTPAVLAAQVYPVRFPEEIHEKVCDTSNHEKAIRDRSAQAIESCYSFGDFLSPESKTLGWNQEEMPVFGDILVFDRTHPAFQVCSPKNAWPKVWEDYRDIVNAKLPKAKVNKKNSSDKHFLRKEHAQRMKVVAVMHPLNRLATAYTAHFRDRKDNKTDIIRKVYGVTGQLSFKNFVHFITKGATDFAQHEELLNDDEFNAEWAPYYRDCPICHPDNFPTFVLKSDDKQRLAAELEVLQEIFGLEEFEFPVTSIETVSASVLKVLYSQLTVREVDELVDFYHVDLQMYQYSPESFYLLAN